MAQFENYSDSLIVNAVAPISITSAANTTPITVDRLHYESVLFQVALGALNSITGGVFVEDSPDNSVWTAVADAYLLGTEAALVIGSTDDAKVGRIGYIGSKRYVRLTITASAATGANFVSAIAILQRPHDGPVAAQGFV